MVSQIFMPNIAPKISVKLGRGGGNFTKSFVKICAFFSGVGGVGAMGFIAHGVRRKHNIKLKD